MKFYIFALAASVLLTFSACSKSQNGTPTVPQSNELFNTANATLLKTGNFAGSSNHTVNGVVKLYEYQGKNYIIFENFTSTNGPDLKVYLATSNSASQFINIGNLKGVTGTQTYLINNPPDFTQYNKVLIWCQQFSVLFGSSTLQ